MEIDDQPFTDVHIFHHFYFRHAQGFLWTQNICCGWDPIPQSIRGNLPLREQLVEHL